MANNRANIRAAVKALLEDETDAGPNVYTNRETSLWQSELPAILIFTSEESSRHEAMNRQRYIRTLTLSIKVKLEESSTIDDDLDALLAEVETIIAANNGLGGTVLSTIQTGTEIRIDTEGENPVGVGELTFECQYIS